MKAKIVPKKEIVLLYRHEQAKNAQALLPLLERLQFDYRLVEDGELGLTVGQLAGYSPAEELPVWSEPPQTPAMAMGGLVGKRLDQLLNEMVKAGIELPVKMVITPHNESWPFGRLVEEVSREHALFMEMERLKKLSDRAHRRLEQQEEQTLREAARQAKDLLARMRLQDDRQPTHEQLSGAADCLQQLLDKM